MNTRTTYFQQIFFCDMCRCDVKKECRFLIKYFLKKYIDLFFRKINYNFVNYMQISYELRQIGYTLLRSI